MAKKGPPARPHYKIEALPPALTSAVQRLLDEGATYSDIAAYLDLMGHQVSRSAVARYGRALARRQEQLEATAAAAKELLEATGDVSLEALASALALDKVVDVLMRLDIGFDEDEEPYLSIGGLTALMRAVASLQGATLQREKWEAELAKRARDAADAVAKVAAEGGLSADTVEHIRRQVLGLGDLP